MLLPKPEEKEKGANWYGKTNIENFWVAANKYPLANAAASINLEQADIEEISEIWGTLELDRVSGEGSSYRST